MVISVTDDRVLCTATLMFLISSLSLVFSFCLCHLLIFIYKSNVSSFSRSLSPFFSPFLSPLFFSPFSFFSFSVLSLYAYISARTCTYLMNVSLSVGLLQCQKWFHHKKVQEWRVVSSSLTNHIFPGSIPLL